MMKKIVAFLLATAISLTFDYSCGRNEQCKSIDGYL